MNKGGRPIIPGSDSPIQEDGVWVLWCSACSSRKPLGEFFRNAGNRNRGYHNYCKKCQKAYDNRRYPNGKPGKRPRYLRQTYGLTPAEYEAMAESQGGKCAICRRVPELLVVDHDHETGVVRGLLCHMCNRCLGLLGEDAEILATAIAYLAAGKARAQDSESAGELCG